MSAWNLDNKVTNRGTSKFGLVFLVFMLTSVLAWGQEGRTGPEWTFTNDSLIEYGRQREQDRLSQGAVLHDALQAELLNKWVHLIKEKCGHCVITDVGSKFKIEFAPNNWFVIAKDPWILEITGSPMTASDLKKNKATLQELVWDTAREVNLKPHSRIGGGHIHLEISTFFKNDTLLFRNFLVDMANHPELFLGGIGFDLLNAPPIAILSAPQREMFAFLIKEFDKGQINIYDLINRIKSEVYKKTFYPEYPHQRAHPDKYQALNLNHQSTVEIRGIKPEISAKHHIQLVELFQKRIEYLSTLRKPVPYNEKDYSNRVKTTTERSLEFHSTDLPVEVIEKAVRTYVEESQLKWADYSQLMTDDMKLRSRSTISCSHIF